MRASESSSPRASADRRGLLRGRRRPFTRLAEFGLRVVSLTALMMLALIFLFVGREAWPILAGQTDAALVRDYLPVETALRLPPAQLRAYLGLTPRELAQLDGSALRELAALRVEAQTNLPVRVRTDPDARANTVAWSYLLRPHAWTGYERPSYIWQPVSLIRKYNLVPLLAGSLKITLISLAVGVPLALAAALYVSQFARPRWREWIKPAIELLASLPSVVVGFLALAILATLLEQPSRAVAGFLGLPVSRLNALVAGLALGLALIPVVFSVAEDALSAVPRTYTHAALALGSTPWQAALRVVVPSAFPGLCAAVLLGFGRAMGETMIVLMASGNAALLSLNIFDPARTATATIAAEMAEAVFGGHHYRMLFLIGLILFVITFASNLLADAVIHRFRQRLEARP